MTGVASAEVRARYCETDQMGVVHHTNYLVWFEIGRTEFLRVHGATYREMEQRNLFMPVLESYCRHHRPARYDDRLRIVTRCERVRRVRLRFDYHVLRVADEQLLADGWTVHAATDAAGTPRRLPPELLRQICPEDAP